MPSLVCKNNPNNRYKGTEPSPKGLGYCASGEKEGKKKKGLDGDWWIVTKASNGVNRWIKFKSNENSSEKLDCSKFVRYEYTFNGTFGKSINKIQGIEVRPRVIRKEIDFNTFEKQETIVPPEYKKVSIKNTKWWINEFHCNNSRELLKKNNPFYKKIKLETKSFTKYFTHDNGAIPFLVYVKDNNVLIYMKDKKNYYTLKSDLSKNIKNNSWMYTELINKYKCNEIFIGKSTKGEETTFVGSYGYEYNGNSILLCITKRKYVYIGETVYEFQTEDNDEIIKYYSPVFNNDVPYPVAYGKKYIYFMIDCVYTPYDIFENYPNVINKKDSELYLKFYDYREDNIFNKKNKKDIPIYKMKNLNIIQKRE